MPSSLRLLLRRCRQTLESAPAALRVWWVLRHHGVLGGSGIQFRGRAPVLDNRGHLVLGDQLVVDSRIFPVRLSVFPGGRLEIGRAVFINQGVNIAATHSVRIGDHCLLGEWVSLLDSDFHPVHSDTPTVRGPIVLGDNVWLANHVTVLRGVTIGDHAVVGAGALVTHDLPARAIAAGNPARVVGTVRCPDDFRRGAVPFPT